MIENVPAESVAELISQECDNLKKMLLEKNKNYGNSALCPLRVFSRSDRVEQIKVRIDDKLSRLARGNSAGEDPEHDISGYLILLRVARRLDNMKKEEPKAKPTAVAPALQESSSPL